MQRKRLSFLYLIVGVSLLTVLRFSTAALASSCEKWVAKVVSVQGTVEAQKAGASSWQLVQFNDTYCAGDTLRVQEKSRADVALLNQSVLRLAANTTITLEGVKDEQTSLVDLVKGAAHFFSRGPRSLEVSTPFTTAGVRGTEFFIRVEDKEALVSVFEGTVVAANQAGSLTLTSGQSAVAEAGKAPALRIVARPRDAVQWALYYPPVLYLRPDELSSGPAWQGALRQSIELQQKGELQKAFDSLAQIPADVRDPRLFAYRASLLLAVGRVEEANADIERALSLAPQDGNALALQTIIALVQNEKEKALDVAQKAVAATPNSASALVALSYAQQAGFDLQGARTTLQKAIDLAPQNALAWARLAELHSSFGELDQSLSAAQQAVALEPNLSRTQTVLGFAYLTRVETTQAKEAFAKAIILDQADPLPRLGLGLAKIREGELSEGSRDLEVAASLDPNNALVRSYLGKAYYEEKSPLDAREYETAQGLDPQDPTPFFYSAIQKQTTNRPVEALHDLQKAAELNDDRAVYRSRLLLDSDLAARSASLARIYSDLGFQEQALVEGWNAVNTDPSNFSAHRFLADSYSALPRHEIARVSELLQSQLLQPLNMTPIQPHLAESNLFLIGAGGPGSLSFNEFNPLFNRDGITAQTGGLFGERNTYAGEGIISGIHKNVAFSFGGFHLTTDGFRRNADQKDDIANAFVQVELSPQTSIQGEYRYRNTDRGDQQQRFFAEDFYPGLKDKRETNTYRLGLRHNFSPASTFLGSFIYQDIKAEQRDSAPPFPGVRFVDFKSLPSSFNVEFQHIFRLPYFTLISGVGYADISGDVATTFGLDLPPPPDGPGPIDVRLTSGASVQHFNVYNYAYINVRKNVTFTLGGSFDSVGGDNEFVRTKDQFNPKFGISWEPISGTTLRLAGFKMLKRTLITNQTLEPTQVAGFNQFYDDVNATSGWRYGGAIDQKFTENLFGSVEFSRRELDNPFIVLSDTGSATGRISNADEYLGRTYLFWTPHPWVALRTGYVFEKFHNEVVRGEEPFDLDTHHVPFGFSFFHPSGLSTSWTATYWNQNGKFQRLATGQKESGSDNFWTVDATINYRLPDRYGFITVGARNLLDEKFKFFNTDLNNPFIQPDRMVFARITLALP